MTSRVSVVCLLLIQCVFLALTTGNELDSASSPFGRYISLSQAGTAAAGPGAGRDRSGGFTRVVRLPPLVPPLHNDEEFSLRQIYSIPRVGKSVDATEQFIGSSAAATDDDDEDNDEGYSLVPADSRRVPSSSAALRTMEERQVFSKIPRVGRRSSRVGGGSGSYAVERSTA